MHARRVVERREQEMTNITKLELTEDEAYIVARAFYALSGETALDANEESLMRKVVAFIGEEIREEDMLAGADKQYEDAIAKAAQLEIAAARLEMDSDTAMWK